MAAQSSRASRFRSDAKEFLCGHGERSILRTSSTKYNPGRRFWGCVQDGCDFFRWADPKTGGVQQEVEFARNRRKITKLKARLKEVETKLWFVGALCIVGWVGFLFLLLQNQYNLKQSNGMHLGYR
ncbi:hypothetical protein Ahy_A06g026548 isoform B [Arachis hypogaea]|uniref:GRF-type domain-containing protein n=1 Tax=Arachis hypogaea TaxID=3818 RepID=A0A445CKS0_ARAHY|nr:hypothetical protein Ahy_A06g026548 isoform B [Arachis hypogaea]